MPKTAAERQREYIARLKARAAAGDAAAAELAALRAELYAAKQRTADLQRKLAAAQQYIERIQKHWLLRWFV